MPIIEVDHLTKRYKRADQNALDGISFSVEPGQFFTLLGPNGAGKTTVVGILTTALAPTSGVARIAGHSVATSASAVRQQIGVIFQKPSLDLTLTGEEHLRLHAILYGLYPYRPSFALMPPAYRQQVHELAALLGLEHDLFKRIKSFSGGMRRKLEIIRSLIHRPRVLFMDEPTVGLDPISRRDLWQYLRRVRAASDTTIFLTTHYLEEAEEADTICMLNKGRIVSYGTPFQVKADLVEEYLLIDAADRDALRAELLRLALPFTETPLFKISLPGRTTYQIIKAIETPLTLVQTHTPTLEEAYFAMVGDT